MKNLQGGLKSRSKMTEERLRNRKLGQEHTQGTERKMTEEKGTSLEAIQRIPIHTLGYPEGRESMKGVEDIFKEIMAYQFPNLMKNNSKQF